MSTLMSEESIVSSVRMPASLYEAIRKAAGENDRSINAEIVRVLRKSFAPAKREKTKRK